MTIHSEFARDRRSQLVAEVIEEDGDTGVVIRMMTYGFTGLDVKMFLTYEDVRHLKEVLDDVVRRRGEEPGEWHTVSPLGYQLERFQEECQRMHLTLRSTTWYDDNEMGERVRLADHVIGVCSNDVSELIESLRDRTSEMLADEGTMAIDRGPTMHGSEDMTGRNPEALWDLVEQYLGCRLDHEEFVDGYRKLCEEHWKQNRAQEGER